MSFCIDCAHSIMRMIKNPAIQLDLIWIWLLDDLPKYGQIDGLQDSKSSSVGTPSMQIFSAHYAEKF